MGTLVLPKSVGAGGGQPLHGQRVGGGDVRARRDAPGGGRASEVIALLDGHRHAVQRTERLAAGASPVGGIGPRPRAFTVFDHHRVDARVVTVDPGEEVLEQLAGAHPAIADLGGELGGGLEMRGAHGGVSGGDGAGATRAGAARSSMAQARGRAAAAP
jgi:hypothetical protein